jgi:phosphoribosyl-ATP pyrophosphohydrolase
MSDSLDRLYEAVLAARDLDPRLSRTARLFRDGHAKMAKKLAEEAIEVVIDAMNGKADAVVRESADLMYNLAVLWVSSGVRPADVWAEMDRREKMLGIAEKLPKSRGKAEALPGEAARDAGAPPPSAAPAAAADRRAIIALDGRRSPKRR